MRAPLPSPDPLMLTVDEAAYIGRCSRSAIERMMIDGKVPSTKFGSRRLIPRAAFYRILGLEMAEEVA